MLSLINIYAEDIEQHRKWLENFDKRRLKRWEALLKADPEAAICEAKTRTLMSNYDIDIQPHEDLSDGGPDFRCSKEGKKFYVETTCISIQAATIASGLNSRCSLDVEAYMDMTEKFCSKIKRKVPQCSSVEGPRVVVVATLHPPASDCCIGEMAAEELLTGTTYITRNINTDTSEPIGNTYESTRLEDSVFIRLNKRLPEWIEHARESVSAVLLCGFGSEPPNIAGCLHPSPNYTFDRKLLPEIKFCRLVDGYQEGRFAVEWV